MTPHPLNPVPDGVNVDEELLAKLENGVLWLTINRADKGNAVPYYVRDRLTQHFPRDHHVHRPGRLGSGYKPR